MKPEELTACLTSPGGFAQYASGGSWKYPRHLEYIDSKIAEIHLGPIRKIIEVPPRHGKSEYCSHWLPAWLLGSLPDSQIILASYQADFAKKWGRKSRDELVRWGPEVFGVEVENGYRAPVDSWRIKNFEGIMYSVGVDGASTGKGADLFLIDDPIKNAAEANSPTYRESIWQWYLSVVETRLEPNASIVILLTRWHTDDIAGRIIAKSKEDGLDDWEIIRLPALADEEDDPLGREIGEALWPERWTQQAMEEKRIKVGAYFWSAMYQGKPTPGSGLIFDRETFRYFERDETHYTLEREPGEFDRIAISACRHFQMVDTATKEKKHNDRTAIGTFAVTPGRDLLVLDVTAERIPVPRQYKFIRLHEERWELVEFVGMEDKMSGIGLIQEAADEGRPFKPLIAEVDKVLRSVTVSIMYENRKVFHSKYGAFLSDLETELATFPQGAFDDRVDVMSYAGLETKTIVFGASLPAGLPQDPETEYHSNKFKPAKPHDRGFFE